MVQSVQKLISRLTFRQLQVFLSVYQAHSYSKAGEQLGLTQPAVSSQVRQLEAALGVPVFEYLGRKLYVTAAGEKLAESLVCVFDELEGLQTELAAQQGKVAGELKLVAVNTAQYVVPYLLKGFLAQNPDVAIQMRVVNRAEALRRLDENEDHLVIMGIVPEDRPLVSLPFLDNEFIAVARSDHALLQHGGQVIDAQVFMAHGLLVREPGSGSRLALEQFCQRQHLSLPVTMELGSNDSIKHAVLAGLGVAILPRLSLLAELELGYLKAVDIPGFPIRRSWCVVYPKRKYPTPAMLAFLEYIQSNLKNIARQFASR